MKSQCSHQNCCENCVICMNDIKSDENTCTLPCKHSFHESCLQQYRENTIVPVCPLCRSKLPLRSLVDEMYDVARCYKRIIKTGYKSKGRHIVHLYITYKSFSEMFLDNHVNIWYSHRVIQPKQKQRFNNKQNHKNIKKFKNYKGKI